MSTAREEFEADLRRFIGYDAENGELFWKEKPNRNIRIGRRIGRPNSWGHMSFSFQGRTCMVHRVIWLIATGSFPKYEIDHIDGDKSNNVLSNLRDVQRAVNQQNMRRAHKSNKSGFLGVFKEPTNHPNRPWRACIKKEGKSISLGYFDTPEKAHEAYLKAKRVMHEGCTL
jgi:hypothetical protein